MAKILRTSREDEGSRPGCAFWFIGLALLLKCLNGGLLIVPQVEEVIELGIIAGFGARDVLLQTSCFRRYPERLARRAPLLLAWRPKRRWG